MNTEEFRALIAHAEKETVDYKAKMHDLKTGRNDFIKDVLAMANTPRKESAYLLFGVQWTPENGSIVIGLDRQIDDVDLQKSFSTDRTQPIPRFSYSPLEYEGKQVGVLEIPISTDGPYTPVKDFDSFLQAGAVYFRRGTENDRALGGELRRIVNWFQGGDTGVPQDSLWENAWQTFLDASRAFDSSTSYLLAVDRLDASVPAPLSALGLVPWRAVIDFDPDSESTGLLSMVQGTISQHGVVHRVVRGESRVSPRPGVHWFFARGLTGRQETLTAEDHKGWVKSYKKELAQQIEALARETSPAPVVVVILWQEIKLRNHLRTLLEELFGAFGQSITAVVASSDEKAFERVADEGGATFVRISPRTLSNGLAVYYGDLLSPSDTKYIVPTLGGASKEIEAKDWLWLSEDLDIVHRNSGLQDDEGPAEFRKGGQISWRALHLQFDCDRDITPALRRNVEDDLKRRQTVRLNLYHAPGGGGTTVGRRVGWELRNMVPVAVLKKCSPKETSEKIGRLSALSENSVLLLVDSGQHSERDIDDLYEFLRAGQTPVVILQILRRFNPQQATKRLFWLPAELNPLEADRFRDVYTAVVPGRASLLSNLAKASGPQRSPFFFGLTAFDGDFYGVAPYVDLRIRNLNGDQKKIIAFIAMAHYYGQQAIPVQAFAGLLGLPRNKTLQLRSGFRDEAAPALELLVPASATEFKTSHPLIALEIMRQIFAATSVDDAASVWKQNLSAWSKDFALFCKGDEGATSDQLLELVRRMFIYRDNAEVLGTERAGSGTFAQLLDDIPSSNGRVDVLSFLTTCFPREAHFHAHLGRLRGSKGEFLEASRDIDFAISIQPEDPLLHHMRGMILRRKLSFEADSGVGIDALVLTAKEASESFETARTYAPDDEHGYISEIQMLIELIDKAQQRSRKAGQRASVSVLPNSYVRQSLERIEDLIDRVHQLYAGEAPSRYVLSASAKLQSLYGDFQTSLQEWDNMLGRADVAKSPIRRQIVWTILRRHDGDWRKLSNKEIRRVCAVLEENLDDEARDSTSLRLWLRAIRYAEKVPSLDSVIERVTYWKINTSSLDSAFYLYALQQVQAINGSILAAADAERSLEASRALSRFRRDRTRSFEWLGTGDSIDSLVHQSNLGEWNGEFWSDVSLLRRVEGRVSSIDGPQKGTIEIPGGGIAFFVPGRSSIASGRDDNARVTFFLGFSYDGPRAWAVELA